jgi:hypothetical protein
MNREKLESLLIDYIDDNLQEEDRHFVEAELRTNPSVREAYEQLRQVIQAMDESETLEPSTQAKVAFEEAVQQEVLNGKKTFLLQPFFYRAAAALLLVVTGIGIGYWLSQQQKLEAEALAVRKETEEKRQLIFSRLDNPYSPSERILGIQATDQPTLPDDEILAALIRTMNEDPNANVRLAALNALARFYEEPTVRKALIASLGLQADPVVQIALIQLMVQIKEKDAIKMFQQIIEKDNVLPAVKDEAYAGVFKLS